MKAKVTEPRCMHANLGCATLAKRAQTTPSCHVSTSLSMVIMKKDCSARPVEPAVDIKYFITPSPERTGNGSHNCVTARHSHFNLVRRKKSWQAHTTCTSLLFILRHPADSRMGRPAASLQNKHVAIAIAKLVTAETEYHSDTVARCGPCSIFAIVKHACPAIIRQSDSGPRDGLSEVELNKVLQVRSISEVRASFPRFVCTNIT